MDMDTEPLRHSPEELYNQFLEYQEKYNQLQQQQYQRRKEFNYSQHDDGDSDKLDEHENIFILANDFRDLLDSHLKVLIDLRNKRSLSKEDEIICKKLEVMLREERNTWSLAKALYKDQLSSEYTNVTNSHNNSNYNNNDLSNGSDAMVDDSYTLNNDNCNININSNGDGEHHCALSEDQIFGKIYLLDAEIRRMQLVTDWLEANEATDSDYTTEDDKAEFYSEGPTAWENTFHAMRAKYAIDIPDLDITINPNAGIELCDAMDPDAPIRTKKALAYADKEVEIRLFKHLFKFLRAGKLFEAQDLAARVGYYWLSAILDGWLPYSDPNLDEESYGITAIHQPSEVRPVSGNRKRGVWKQTCFKASRLHGLTSFEKALLGFLGANLKSVLPICNSWSDQLWARLRCSIDIKIEKALRKNTPQENRDIKDYPKEFYENYQNLSATFKSIQDQRIISSYKEATIHQTVQKHLILNDINGLLEQLGEWCLNLDYDNNVAENDEAISPLHLRFFAHVVLFLRELNLITADDPKGTLIIETYIGLLTKRKSIESVAHYTMYLPENNQISSYAKLLATINDNDERKHCLKIAGQSNLDIDLITQTVVQLIRDEPSEVGNMSTSITPIDKRKINALDYLLYLEGKNYMAILHHGNALLRYFALQNKTDAVKETFLKLPVHLSVSVENQWRVRTNKDMPTSLRNNIRELQGFKLMLDAQDELNQWHTLHLKRPEEPKRPADLSKFCDTVNYEQSVKQYQQDINLWNDEREVRTNTLTVKIMELFRYSGGWMKDLESTEQQLPANGESFSKRLEELVKIRKIFIPQMASVLFNIYYLTRRYEDCLKLSHLLVQEDLKLYSEYTKVQIRDFLEKISDVTKKILSESIRAG